MLKKQKILGISAASLTALLQGVEGLLIPLFGLIFSLITFQSFGFSLGLLTLKEVFTFILVIFTIISPKRFVNLFKEFKKKKEIKFFLYASFFGTILGNLFFIMSIQFAGASYGVVLTSLYPVFSMLIAKMIMKEKEPKKVWMGVFLSFVGAIMFALIPPIIEHQSFNLMKFIGILFGLLAAILWAIEGFFLNQGFRRRKDNSITVSDVVAIRCFGTTIASLIFLLPLGVILNKTIGSHNSSFADPTTLIGNILKDWKSLILILALCVNLIILRKLHAFAIEKIGSKLTAIIDTNNFIIPAFFSIFLIFGNWTFFGSNDPLYSSIKWESWLLVIPILVGIILVITYHKPAFFEKNEKIIT